MTPDGYAVNTEAAARTSRADPAAPRAAIPASPNPAAHPLSAPAQKTIGDTLSAKGISWAWYAGGWDAAARTACSRPA